MRIPCNVARLVVRGLVAAALALLLSAPLRAQPSSPASPDKPAGDAEEPAGEAQAAEPDDAAKLAEAKELFREGNALRKVGDYERALAKYVASRELVASGPNTMNTAFCLDKLGRYDEALEMYEVLLTKFPDELTAADREVVAPMVARLRGMVGSIEVQANVAGSLVIEGRPRGDLPRVTPVRVLPGKRNVTVIKEGYRTFQKTVEVKAGETARVDAKLEPLAASGRVRIDEKAVRCHGLHPSACAGASIYIDGAPVGAVPWEGELAPGSHWLVVRKGDVGSAPQKVVVVKGQVVFPAVVTAPLGPEITITVAPHTAAVNIGDVPVGTGGWRGRLPLGVHKVGAREEGYFDGGHPVSIEPHLGGNIFIRLEVDEEHARWGVVESELGAAGVLTFVGYGLGVAGIAVGSIFGGMTLSDKADLEEKCIKACTQQEIDDLRTRAHVSTIGFVAAGAGVALGTIAMIIWLTDDDEPQTGRQLKLRPYASGGLALEGSF